MKDPIEDQVIGDYHFHWGEFGAICYTGAQGHDAPEAKTLFLILLNDYKSFVDKSFRDLGQEWTMMLPEGKIRAVALTVETWEVGRDGIIAMKAIMAFKELGYGEGLAW